MDDGNETDAASGRQSKVARLIKQYGLEGFGDELVRLWTAEGETRRSLRELADSFNHRLFEAALADAGVDLLSDEIEARYRILATDAGDAGEETRIRRRLEREGLDVDALLDDFVSYQAIRTYLKDERNAEYTQPESDRVETAADSIQRLRSRTVTVTESRLDQLRNAGRIALGEYRTILDLNVICEECGTQYDVNDLLERGGCDCHQSATK